MVEKADVFVYMEGGGEANDLRSECRRAMAEFFSKTKLGKMHRPRVVACGSRGTALGDFCIALSQGKNAVLLVDSEDPIDPVNESSTSGFKPWSHLKQRDNWDKPTGATDLDCHLMVQCMEAWIVSDWRTDADERARWRICGVG
jgi:Domain of unknown function (DUF4276)